MGVAQVQLTVDEDNYGKICKKLMSNILMGSVVFFIELNT